MAHSGLLLLHHRHFILQANRALVKVRQIFPPIGVNDAERNFALVSIDFWDQIWTSLWPLQY